MKFSISFNRRVFVMKKEIIVITERKLSHIGSAGVYSKRKGCAHNKSKVFLFKEDPCSEVTWFAMIMKAERINLF